MYDAIGKLVVWGIAAIIGLLVVIPLIELFRRWFVKPEYYCRHCGSRFTLLSGKYFGISTGSYYQIRCLVCGETTDYKYSYYFGKGMRVGRKWIGWEHRALSDIKAEDERIGQIMAKKYGRRD